MINAIAGFSDLGAALTLSNAAYVRRTQGVPSALSGDDESPGTIQPVDRVNRLDPTQPAAPPEDAQKRQTNPNAPADEPIVDIVEFSPQGLAAAKRAQNEAPGQAIRSVAELDEEEQKEVTELEQRDQEVRTHEQAHKAAGGSYAGGITFEYQQGPDGKRYAVGGEVPIDVSPVSGDPQATIQKMQQVRRAALAPAQPSAADRHVAAKAAQLESKAHAELAQQKQGEGHGTQDDQTNMSPAKAAFGPPAAEAPTIDVYA